MIIKIDGQMYGSWILQYNDLLVISKNIYTKIQQKNSI